MDLRGLAGLSSRILALLSDEEGTSHDGLELFGVSRICERHGAVKRARKLYEQSIASALPMETDRVARAALARLSKRDGDLARAHELWESAVGNTREGYEAYEQLAIYYEHEARDPRRALTLAREALDQLRHANQVGTMGMSIYRTSRERFEYRLSRLERKAGRTLLDRLDA
jgi:tetratricopeptide (TPR) repeat protein